METFHVYFSIKEKKESGLFAYLLYDEKGNLVQKERISQKLHPQHQNQYVFQVVIDVMKRLLKKGVKKLTMHTHHPHYHAILRDLMVGKREKNFLQYAKQYPQLQHYSAQFVALHYELRTKAENKTACRYLQDGQLVDRPIRSVAHVDVSVDWRQKDSYIAGVLKTIHGEVITRYSKRAPYTEDTTWLEICAVVEMMKQASEKGGTPVVIHTDNQSTFNYFSQSITKRKKNEEIVQFVENAKRSYPECIVRYVRRNQNEEAHELARQYKEVSDSAYMC